MSKQKKKKSSSIFSIFSRRKRRKEKDKQRRKRSNNTFPVVLTSSIVESFQLSMQHIENCLSNENHETSSNVDDLSQQMTHNIIYLSSLNENSKVNDTATSVRSKKEQIELHSFILVQGVIAQSIKEENGVIDFDPVLIGEAIKVVLKSLHGGPLISSFNTTNDRTDIVDDYIVVGGKVYKEYYEDVMKSTELQTLDYNDDHNTNKYKLFVYLVRHLARLACIITMRESEQIDDTEEESYSVLESHDICEKFGNIFGPIICCQDEQQQQAAIRRITMIIRNFISERNNNNPRKQKNERRFLPLPQTPECNKSEYDPGDSTGETEEGYTLPEGWIELIDPDTNTTYYYNEIYNISTWDKPRCINLTTCSPSVEKPPREEQNEAENEDKTSQGMNIVRSSHTHLSLTSAQKCNGVNHLRYKDTVRRAEIQIKEANRILQQIDSLLPISSFPFL